MIGKIRFSYITVFLFILHEFAKIDRTSKKRNVESQGNRAMNFEFWIEKTRNKKTRRDRSTSFDPIEEDPVRFLLSKLGQIYREFVGTNRQRCDNASKKIHTFIVKSQLFFILIRIFLFKDFKIYKRDSHEIPCFLDPIKLISHQ